MIGTPNTNVSRSFKDQHLYLGGLTMGINVARSILAEATRLKEAGEKGEAYYKYLKFIYEVIFNVLGPGVLLNSEWPQLPSAQAHSLFRFCQQTLDKCEECLPVVINILTVEADRLDELEAMPESSLMASLAATTSNVSMSPTGNAVPESPLMRALRGGESYEDLPLLDKSDRPIPVIPVSRLFIQHSQMTWRIQRLYEQLRLMQQQGGKDKGNALYLNTLREKLRELEEWTEKRRLVIANIVRTWEYDLTGQSAVDIAYELMQISWDIFRGIPAEEWKLAAEGQLDPMDMASKAPGIAHTQDFFAFISSWVRLEVLRPTDSDTRMRHLLHWIAVAMELKRLNGFDPMVAVMAGLNNASIKRTCLISLRRLPPRQKFELEDLAAHVSENNGYSGLRHLHLVSDGACVPFLGIYLNDCRNAIRLGLKAAKEAEQMLEIILKAQSRDCMIVPRNDLLNHWILSRPFLTSEELYELADRHRERGDLKLGPVQDANVPEARIMPDDQDSVMFEMVGKSLRELQQK